MFFQLFDTIQIEVEAYDSVYPNNKASVKLALSVRRNPNAPLLSSQAYSNALSTSFPLGDTFRTVSATDADNVSTLLR